jgi:hypothetical protein
VASDNQVGMLSRGRFQDLICGVTCKYVRVQFHVSLLGFPAQAFEQLLEMGRSRFDGGLRTPALGR